ncbi:MAG TPA: FKBP-type peptidyl-prolyl cis-trans isomerase [Solirubrobacteraceae bacterium]|nr:FKBP-type peptidyl-prolyl cis-trans isomerase [Solirubrobacteraceae bacterium]
MNNSSGLIPRLTGARTRALALLATLALVALLAGCGSSSNSSGTIGVGNENTADEALVKAGETPVAKTPTSGPLATEPKVTPPTGPAPAKLEKKDLIVGSGAEAKAGQTVTVNYVGVLYKGGKEFDASWKRKEPFQFKLGQGQVIKGWDEGIPGMKVGGRRELVIPAELAYGKAGSPPTIPPNATLVFVIDLLGT